MHTFQPTEEHKDGYHWEVVFRDFNGSSKRIAEFTTIEDAEAYTSYLNGGRRYTPKR